MKRGRTTSIICQNTDGYFAAFLDNSGVRVGFLGEICFDFPEYHEDFIRCTKLTVDTVEDAFDEFMSKYR